MRAADKESDLWETPADLFDQLDKEFQFKIDLCASSGNNKVPMYAKDFFALEAREFRGCTGFMNPPYSNPLPYIKKAYNDSEYMVIVCLIKADTSTKAWGVFWDYENHCPKHGVKVRFLPKRLKFERGGEPSTNTANFPSAVVIMYKGL